jgi:dienelactone hydrolase
MPIIEKQWTTTVEQPVSMEVGGVHLTGDLIVPEEAFGLVLFAVEGGVGRSDSLNRRIAREFEEQGLAVLLVDLLTAREKDADLGTGRLSADTSLLSGRLLGVAEWAARQEDLRDLPIGIFAPGATAPAALASAAERPRMLGGIVCVSGRVDLAGNGLARVDAPVRLLASANDGALAEANESVLLRLGSRRRELILIPGGSPRLEEPEEIEAIADLAAEWFSQCLIELC